MLVLLEVWLSTFINILPLWAVSGEASAWVGLAAEFFGLLAVVGPYVCMDERTRDVLDCIITLLSIEDLRPS